MTLELADGRGELFQWDTGRIIEFGEDAVSQAHFTNTEKVINIPYTVEVKNRKAAIPDELLQVPGKLIVYAWVSDTNGGYTKVQVNFPVFARPKPSDYVYTPTEHAGFDRLRAEIGDLSALQTDVKDNLVAAINEAAESGGSSDAVLYTAQTLTDAQKQQARENVDAAIADFMVNATLNFGGIARLDKTFEQIKEAITAGRNPVVHVSGLDAIESYLQLAAYSVSFVRFVGMAMNDERDCAITFELIVKSDIATYSISYLPAADTYGFMPQVSMLSLPTKDMQIATKKYVDDKEFILQSTTPGSSKKFKITVDDSGVLSAAEVTE